MRYVRERLRRLPTRYLAIYVALADVLLLAGAIPFEFYCQRAAAAHSANVPFLLAMLLANLGLMLFALSGMLASSLLVGRGVLKASALLKAALRPPRPALVAVRPGRSLRNIR